MSDLLNSASLVMIPSGYKEDVVYSQIPTDGSGDLTFTRASNGTRVNSAGLVEVVPWNILSYSSDMSNSYWVKRGFAQLATNATAPDGSANAYKIQENNTDDNPGLVITDMVTPNGTYTFFVWLKGDGNYSFNLSTNGGSEGSTINVTTSWQLFSVTQTNVPYNGPHIGGFNSIARNSGIVLYVWHPQLNIGSNAKPYFPTTDRLNVPRLTYQNGGGGCPSLLLEKQSTNLVTYSEQFDNGAWGKVSATITEDTTISPDGTQDADTFTTTGGGARIFQTLSLGVGSYTTSIYVKKLSGSGNMRFFGIVDGSGVSQSFTPTDNWQRFTGNFTASTGITEMQLREDGFSGSLAIWGFQLEESSYATSYIRTTSSSATRVADACFKTGISSLIGQSEGTIFVEFKFDYSDSNTQVLLKANQTTDANSVGIEVQGTTIKGLVNSGGSNVATITGTIATGTIKAALAYKTNDMAFYVNGTQVGVDTSGSIAFAGVVDILTIGQFLLNGSSFFPSSRPFNQAILFPTRLTNAELASLTTI